MRRLVTKIRWLLATGFCFVFFFVGALVMTVCCFPVIYATGREPIENQRRCRRVVQKVFAFFVTMMSTLGLIRVSFDGEERLAQAAGCLVIANHPTLIDVVILFAKTPNANCVVKESLWHSPYLGWLMRATGFISNDNGEKLLDNCRASLDRGDAIVIFPEGSRTRLKQGFQLKRGVAHIAVRVNVPLLPVLISCEPLTLIKDQAWYALPERCCDLHFSVQELIKPEQLLSHFHEKPAAARQLTQYLTNYFERELEPFYERYYKPD